MAFVLADRVQETTTTTGTGTVTLAGAVSGYQSFAAVGNGNTTYYTIAAQTGTEWEVGIGTYTSSGTTLSRTTVLSSSNSGSLVNFSAGTKNVFVDYPAGKAVYLDSSNNASALGTVASATLTNATGLPLTTGVTGTLPIGNGGTGQTTANTAFNALAPSQTGNSGKYLTTDGTNSSWGTVSAGASLSNDTSTSSNLYPIFAAATSGTPTTVYTSNAKLLYKPSTGELQASELVASNGLVVNSSTVSASYTVASGYNAMSVGPITVASGQSVTVTSGQRWVVL
jgi:hypothetical protein